MSRQTMGTEEEPQPTIPFSKPDIRERDTEAVLDVLLSGWLTTGRECSTLERELESYIGVSHVVAMSSCTAALETAVAYLGLSKGARIAVPTWTFVSTALSAVRDGAIPVLVDVDSDTLNMAPDALAAAIRAGVDAVMLVHFGGVPVDKEIHDLCASVGLPVIEDAAHALGASDHRGRVGGRGSVSACFSFYATKNLTCGEGGALATDNDDVAAFARSYRLHGLSTDTWSRERADDSPGYDLLRPGIKANLPDLLAALARSQLGRFDEMQARRRTIVNRYRSRLGQDDGITIVPPELAPGGADHLMVVVLPEEVDRRAVAKSMAADGIGTSVHFRPLHRFEWFACNAVVGPAGTRTADRLARRVLSLPLHPGMTDDEVDRVCQSLQAATDQ
jgi:dTDP-4-amino-4,6-dideoxygalactose transaminase